MRGMMRVWVDRRKDGRMGERMVGGWWEGGGRMVGRCWAGGGRVLGGWWEGGGRMGKSGSFQTEARLLGMRSSLF